MKRVLSCVSSASTHYLVSLSPSKILCTALVGLCMLISTSCSSSGLQQLAQSAVRDGSITPEEWSSLVAEAAKEGLYHTEDGQVKHEELTQYLHEVVGEMRGVPPLSFVDRCNEPQPIETEPIAVKFFLERSGSMLPYDAPETKGDFKTIISKLLNNLPNATGDENLIYVVNGEINRYPRSLRDFLKSKDIFTETQGIGDARYTDFTAIFDSIASNTHANELSILASDLIYSTKDMEEVNPQKIMNEAQALTTNVFKGHTDKEVLLLRFSSDFSGLYYPYNTPSQGVQYRGQRPFYIMMVGGASVIDRLFTDPNYREFVDFERLPQYEQSYYFGTRVKTPNFSALLSSPYNVGRFAAQKGSDRAIVGIEDLEHERDGELAITLAVDLSGLTVPQAQILDPSNYELKSLSGFTLSEVKPLTEQERSPSIERYASKATHLFVLKTKEPIKNEELELSLSNKFPDWIIEGSSSDDRDTKAEDFATKTFALDYLTRGIYDSFYPSTVSPKVFTIKLSIKK